jgi:hypothetical protein
VHRFTLSDRVDLVLGPRTSRPHSAAGAQDLDPPIFALRAQCGRDVRAPSEMEPLILKAGSWYLHYFVVMLARSM